VDFIVRKEFSKMTQDFIITLWATKLDTDGVTTIKDICLGTYATPQLARQAAQAYVAKATTDPTEIIVTV
jgi:hypothetical protein